MSHSQHEDAWLEILNKITGLAQSGLYYTKDIYDRERFQQLLVHVQELLEIKTLNTANFMQDVMQDISYAIGVIFAYFGLSALHVLNQNLVYRISLQARSRINSIYMTLYFGGAALGSLLAVNAWKHWGWMACVILGLSMAVMSFVIDRYDFHKMKNHKADQALP